MASTLFFRILAAHYREEKKCPLYGSRVCLLVSNQLRAANTDRFCLKSPVEIYIKTVGQILFSAILIYSKAYCT
jgi:hypothetical protein